jgi:hypothetical protein
LRRSHFIFAALLCACGKPSSPGPTPSAGSSSSASPVSAPLPPLSEDERRAAEDKAVEYFGALATKDCSVLLRIVRGLSASDCKEDVHDWESHGASLLEVLGVVRDGRAPTALIVTARVRYDQKSREQLVRIVKGESGLQVYK